MKIYTTTFPTRPDNVMACAIVRMSSLERDTPILPLEQLPAEKNDDDVVFGGKGGHDPSEEIYADPGDLEHSNGAPYSTAGLAWDAYGRDVVGAFLGEYPEWAQYVDSAHLFETVRGTLIAGIDAAAAGRLHLEARIRVPKDREPPKAYVPVLPRMLADYNVSALDATRMSRQQLVKAQRRDFEDAVELATESLANSLRHHLLRFATPELIKGLPDLGGFLELPSGFLPWQEGVFARPDHKSIHFVTFPCAFSRQEYWMVQAVPKSPKKRAMSKTVFPEEAKAWEGMVSLNRRWLARVENREAAYEIVRRVLRSP